jgi:GYF domain 2
MSTPTLWYYYKDGRGFGPVEDADIRGLLEHNEIAADTLVWRDGLVRLQMVWDNLSCLGTEALAHWG